MKNDLVPFRFRAAGALFALVLPLTLAGQTAPPASAPKSTDEMISLSPFVVNADADSGYKAGNSVSATRVQVPIKDLPFMMNVYTEEFMRDLNTQDISDVLRFSPNVGNSSNDFGNGDLKFNLRGFSINVVQRNGLQGLRNASLNNVARVEVVKGPASVLYGQVAPGGIVNYITKKPLEKPFQEARVMVGNEGRTQSELDVTGPISAKDGLFYRLNGLYMEGKRSLTPYHNTRYSVAPSLIWNLFGKKEVTLSLDYERYYSNEDPPAWARPNTPVWGYEVDNAGNLSYSSFATGPAPTKKMNAPFNYDLPENFNQVSNTDLRRIRIENAVAELNAKLPFGVNMRAASSFYSYDTIYLVSGIASIYGGAAFTTAPNVAADPRNARNAPVLTTTILRTNPNGSIVYAPVRNADGSIAQVSDSLMQRRMSSEHLLGTTRRHQVDFFRSFDFDWAKFHLVGGMDWLDAWAMYRNARIKDALWTNITWDLRDPSTWNRNNQWANSEVLSLANAQLIQPVPATSNAIYQGGQTEGAGSPTRGTYGMLRAGFLDNRLMLLAGLRRNDLIQNVRKPVNSPQYGITGKVTRNVSLYASYSEAYIPNFGNRVIEGVIVGPQVPTVGKGYDFGAKIDLLEGRLSGAISYFSSVNTGAVVQTASFNTLGQLVTTTDQTGEQESSGIELDATIQLSRNWKTYVSYGRQDPKVKSQNDRPWMVGSALVDAPKDTAGLQTRYDIRSGDYKGLYFGGGATYTGTKVQRNSSSALYPIGRDPVSGKIINLPGFPKNGPAFEYKADPYTLVSLMAGYNFYRGKYGYTVQANVSNLFDEFYMPSNLSRGDGRRYSLSIAVRH